MFERKIEPHMMRHDHKNTGTSMASKDLNTRRLMLKLLENGEIEARHLARLEFPGEIL